MTFFSRAIQLALILLVSVASAKEGFSAEPLLLPEPVRKVWQASFAFIVSSPKLHIGTAFLIRKEATEGQLDLYFLTADHNVINCQKNQVCPHHILMQDAVFQETPQLVEYTSGRLRFDKVTLEAELREPRLAILRVRAPLGTVVPEPVRLTQTCDIQPGTKIYAIGWPFTPSRTVPSKGTGRPELDLKRWSEGVYVGHLKLKNEAYPYFATTNDSLTGLSGGPLLTEQGIVMSIAQKGATASGNAYTGNDDTKEWHTLGSHCEFTKAIGQNM